MAVNLGKYGIWCWWNGVDEELAVEIEKLGYGAIWLGGNPPGDLAHVEKLLDATSSITVATGIVNMWTDDAPTVGASYLRIAANHPDRFLLGVGVGHPEAQQEYQKPYDKIVSYLDQLDEVGVPAEGRALAALGPKVLKLSAQRALGAHPYLTTPEHTREAREQLGRGVLLAPEQKVVLDTDAERARATARPPINNPYLGLVNYRNNLKRLGWSESDIDDGGSDALIDRLGLHGDAATVAAGVKKHIEAGADHVSIQALPMKADPLPTYRALAEHLL
ncbi:MULTISPECIES: LLM class F420-dependent oxidoreductase [Prauserella salsuginis group]|uniref:LLM class F420-dependent oxidoreductase n=1 Tax=Prauserella salsuginis TaxID=387889 RepID=A0ABW6G0H2_9PSEU|nr:MULTISPECIES: LLM class F420-dependent oxidoreductase [Prauserella salsuginis group]MCR3721317.1 putative F420-dependent oxidoreductase, MSMEG_4141 family [Prauserella flava]MCR3734603.1 putative F420-dependent oxidoreductase, MSMEG_4141 family [Prauserella salsuginis]